MDFLWLLIQTNKLSKKYDIYETTGNVNTDLIFDDIKKSLLVSFRGDNSIMDMFFTKTHLINPYLRGILTYLWLCSWTLESVGHRKTSAPGLQWGWWFLANTRVPRRCLVTDGRGLAELWVAHGATWWKRTWWSLVCLSDFMGSSQIAWQES